ncbi:MAG: DMT family transporter [Betaproteobacteria bacterium]|jgi:drug/metabolite transporter (DMT)-like permease
MTHMFSKHPSTALALAAIALWSSLALLGTLLSHIPPFLLTGIALLVGSVPAWPFFRQWRVSWAALALGVYGLFGFHFFLFMALRHAPAVEANLVNYLWPLGIVLMTPVFLPGVRLSATHLLAALTGFVGAAIAILGDTLLHSGLAGLASKGFAGGYLAAAASAFIWASYSLMGKRMSLTGRGFPTAAIGLFGLVSGALSLLCHALLEAAVTLSAQDWLLTVVMGLGPLGAAFFLWDAALKNGDARKIGILSYITPLASTVLLLLATGRLLSWGIGVAAVLILGAAALGSRAK